MRRSEPASPQGLPPEPSPTLRELVADDRGTVRRSILEREFRDPGPVAVPAEVFHSPEIHRLEVERLWGRVWQLACFEQEVRETGDYAEYVIADRSILVLRDGDGRVRAFHNVCRHRGNRLRAGSGNASELRCGFHAWCWTLDGRLADVPAREDFPGLRDEDAGLVECRVATWKGLVFVCFDAAAAPLEDFLGETVLRHFAEWPFERRWKAVHVARVMPCNWKLAIEAFMESYHVFRTHPQTIPYVADASVQYDAYGVHGRFVTPTGAPSLRAHVPPSPQETVDHMVGGMVADLFGGADREVEMPHVPSGESARPTLAAFLRAQLGARLGVDFSAASDSEMLDLAGYTIFPNVVVFLGEELPVLYRARPWGADAATSLFEVIVHVPLPPGASAPPAAPMRLLPAGARWSDAPELGGLGPIFDQDTANLERIQLGQHSPGFPGPIFAHRQEVLLRQLHRNLAEWLARP